MQRWQIGAACQDTGQEGAYASRRRAGPRALNRGEASEYPKGEWDEKVDVLVEWKG